MRDLSRGKGAEIGFQTSKTVFLSQSIVFSDLIGADKGTILAGGLTLRDVAEDAQRACCHSLIQILDPSLPSDAPEILLLRFLLASVT